MEGNNSRGESNPLFDRCVVCGSEYTVIAQLGTGEAFCNTHGNSLNKEYQEWRTNHPAPQIKPWIFDPNPTTFDGGNYVTGGYNPPKTKPYIVTIEVDAHNLDEAKTAAFALASGDGGGNWSGEVTSVVQKYRMTNFGTEWHKR